MDKNLKLFTEYLEAEGLEENTIDLYINQINLAFNSNAFDDLSKFHSFINRRRGELSDNSFNTNLYALRSFSRFCKIYELPDVDSKLVDRINEIKTITNPQPVQERRAYTTDELDLIFNSRIKPWRYQYLFTAVNFGFRASEIRTLELEDIDLDNKLITIRKENSKGKRARSVPITAKVFSKISTWVNLARPNQRWYVEARIGKQVSKRSTQYWKSLENQTGLDIKVHNFRYTYATQLYQASKDIVLVQLMLGHKDVSMTQKYLKITPDDLEKQYRKLNFRVF